MLSRRVQKLTSFIAMDILEESQNLQTKGHDVISFSVGEPDFPAPEVVRRATIEAIEGGRTKYTHSLGMPELRAAIADHYRRRYGVALHSDQILVTPGTSPAMLAVFGALLSRGDEVIMSDPHYPCYTNFIRFLDGKVSFVRVREADGFQYRPEEVKKKLNRRTKAIFINSPSNPTGCTLSADVMRQLTKLGKYIVSDEIYHGLTYEGEEHSILEFTDRAFVFNGFSKAYAMTGFRLGYCIFPREFTAVVQKMAQNFFISTSHFIQIGGIAALTQAGPDQRRMRGIFNERRKAMVAGLKKLGFGIAVEPTGAFYVFANAKHLTRNTHRFAFDLLQKAKVGITPGIDFGRGGEGYLRFSYATDITKIREGLRRIEAYLKKKG
jgi:aspartate/methionine/tyrosine aminotransferase